MLTDYVLLQEGLFLCYTRMLSRQSKVPCLIGLQTLVCVDELEILKIKWIYILYCYHLFVPLHQKQRQ